MPEAKHTPGPWAVTQRDGQAAVQGAATEWVATMPYAPCEGFGLNDVFEVNANARLIGAAPDLLEAIEHLVELFVDTSVGEKPEEERAVINARAAIAKATGES